MSSVNWSELGREGLKNRHSVFEVHDIPPAAYFGTYPKQKGCDMGEVRSAGLWDEAVDEPIAYPFVADKSGFCYIPNFAVESVAEAYPYYETRYPNLAQQDDNKPQLKNPSSDCKLTCKWND